MSISANIITQLTKTECSLPHYQSHGVDERKILLKNFTQFQFSCCPLIWMFDSKTLNNKKEQITQKTIKISVFGFQV